MLSESEIPYYQDPAFVSSDDIEEDLRDVSTKNGVKLVDNELDDLVKSLSPPTTATDAQPDNPAATALPAEVGGQDGAEDVPDVSLDDIVNEDPSQGGITDQIVDVARGVARGAAKTVSTAADVATSAVVHGPMKAADAMFALGDELGIGPMSEALEATLPLGAIQFTDPETGEMDIRYVNPEEMKQRKEWGESFRTQIPPSLMGYYGPRTTAGDIASSISQFAVGYALGGKVISDVKGKGMAVLRNFGRGAFADFVAFDSQEKRLSDILAKSDNPAFNNAVTEFLASDKEDPALVSRLKRAGEGVVVGAVFGAFLQALRQIKYLRRLRTKAIADGAEVKPNQALPSKNPDMLLGDPNAPLVSDQASGAWTELSKYIKDAASGARDKDIEKIAKTGEAGDKVRGTTVNDPAGPTMGPLGQIPGGTEPIGIGSETVFVNYAAINTGEDVHRVIQHLSEVASKNVDKARRGTVSWQDSALRASQLNGWDLLMERGHRPLREDELLASRELWIATADKVMRLSQIAARDGSPENIFAARKMVSIFQMINEQMLGAQAEAGRALQILRRPVGLPPDHMAKFIADSLASTGGIDANLEYFKNLAKLADDPTMYGKLFERTQPKTMARIIGGLQDFWIGGSLLTGPKTFMRNAVSNLTVTINEAVERAVASHATQILDIPNGPQIGEGLKYLTGAFGAIKQAAIAAGKAGYYNQSAFGRSAFDMGGHIRAASHGTPIAGTPLGWAIDALGAYSSLSSRILVGTDDFFKTVNHTGELASLAHRTALEDIKAGRVPGSQYKDRVAELMSNPPPWMAQAAYDQAHYSTFTSPPGVITRSLLTIAHEHPSLRWIIPFMTTPANLFRYAAERSPLGFMTKRYKEAVDKGGVEAVMARTRIGLGTMVNLMALDMAIEGKLVGDVVSGKDASPGQVEWERRNGQPFSVRVGSDEDAKYFSFQGTDPLGITLGINAQFGNIIRGSGDNDVTDEDAEDFQRAISASIFYAANYALSRSYMTGLNDFLEAADDPRGAGSRWSAKFAASFVPNWMGEVNRAMDPVVRDATTLSNQLQRKLLFMSPNVPAIVDRFGRKSTYESGFGKVYDLVSPFYAKSVKLTPWELEERRQGFYVQPPSKSLQIEKVRISLATHPDIYHRYKEIRGMKPSEMGGGQGRLAQKLMRKYGDLSLLDLLNDIVQGNHRLYNEYMDRTDGAGNEKDRMIDRIVADYGKAAREALINEEPMIRTLIQREKLKLRQRDLNVDAN
jgi:hypothetical protein